MSTFNIQKELKKQQREAKRLADRQLKAQKEQMQREEKYRIASSIVEGQPIIGGMRIMDPSSEEILECILSIYNENENREVHGNETNIPLAYQSSLALEFDKLKLYGVLSRTCVYFTGAWEVVVTPQGLTYFEDKIQAKEKKRICISHQ